jgi:hypothetical protein
LQEELGTGENCRGREEKSIVIVQVDREGLGE